MLTSLEKADKQNDLNPYFNNICYFYIGGETTDK